MCKLLAISVGMAQRRMFSEGMSHHVIHRGNNRCDIFRDADDHEVFALLLRRAIRRFYVALHAQAQMTNHVHLLVTAEDEKGLPKMMQSLCRNYVRYFNDRHGRTGTLWEGRYRASLILTERHWLSCMRYVELNPTRAHLVEAPGDYHWSSYASNALGRVDSSLTPHTLYLALGSTSTERCTAWRTLCGDACSDEELATVRQAIHYGWTIGDAPETPAGGKKLILVTKP